MSGIYLYDDARARRFQPFALSRPLSEMVAGAVIQRERWEAVLRLPAQGFVSSPHLADFEELSACSATTRAVPAGAILVNTRFVPRLRAASPAAGETATTDLWIADGRAVAVRTTREVPLDLLASGELPLDELARNTAETQTLDGWWHEEVWDYLRHLPAELTADIEFLTSASNARGVTPPSAVPPHATVLGEHSVVVAADRVVERDVMVKGATVEAHVVFDASAGPIYVAAEATIHAFSRIVGPCYIGRKSTVLGGEVHACSIGDVCKVRGEINGSVMLGHANKGHDGFVGHSYLGRWVNLGAGTTTSNLKNTYGTVALWTPSPDGVRDTGLRFLGTLFGDHAKTGIGLMLTTGTVLGTGANVFEHMPPKAVPPFAWGSAAPYETYRLDKFLEVAERVMARRHVTLGARARRQLEAAYAARWFVDEKP